MYWIIIVTHRELLQLTFNTLAHFILVYTLTLYLNNKLRKLEKGRREESWEGKGQEEIDEQEEHKEELGGGWDRHKWKEGK